MVTVTQLPPQAVPKQLTAQRQTGSLEEHLLAFLNHNNPKGFGDDDVYQPVTMDQILGVSPDEIFKVIVRIINHKDISIRRLKQSAKTITKLSDKNVKLQKVMFLLARIIGYRNWELMMQENHVQSFEAKPLPRCQTGEFYKVASKQRVKDKRSHETDARILVRRDFDNFKLKDLMFVGNQSRPSPSVSE